MNPSHKHTIDQTFHESRDAHDREYLTRVLTATGGERQRAAEIAGLNRTHLQKLISRHEIKIPMNPKARGRRVGKSVASDADDETAEAQTARNPVRL